MIIKKDHGVTLIELLIVMVIAAFLVAGIYSLFITQHRSYSVQDQVAGVQQDARVALDIMARDVRMAGCMIGSEGFDVNGAQFAVTPNNNTTIPDSITIAGAADQFMSGGNPVTVRSIDASTVTLGVYNSATATWSNVDDIDSFFDTDKERFVAFESDSTYVLYQISNITGQVLTLNSPPPANLATILGTDSTGTPVTVGARVFRVKAITYSVTALNGNPGVGVLRRNENTGNGAQPLAGDGITTFVEDLQVAYQVAGNNDWIFDEDTAAWPAGTTNADIRMVRISLVVRTAVPDSQDTSFSRPACEDHVASATNDGFRRRVYTTVVKVRNL
jgi:type IV pilus assembly protein PilW